MAAILVIDDEPLVRSTIRFGLERAGHRVAEAPDGRVGKEMFERQRYDLVITDIIMPEEEGIATIRALKRRDPGIKILAISGGGRSANSDFLEAAAKLGADATLPKPFTAEELLGTVNALLAGKPSSGPGKR